MLVVDGAMMTRLFAIFLVGAAVAAPVAAQAPGLAMLQTLERGQWRLVTRDGSSAPASICLGDPRQLLQTAHMGARCTLFTVNDTPSSVTVSYDCGAAGNGSTTVRRETSRLVQVETQGIARGAPFSEAFEARHSGACTR